jgi:hypothetical protein
MKFESFRPRGRGKAQTESYAPSPYTSKADLIVRVVSPVDISILTGMQTSVNGQP